MDYKAYFVDSQRGQTCDYELMLLKFAYVHVSVVFSPSHIVSDKHHWGPD